MTAPLTKVLLDELRNIVELHNGDSEEMMGCATSAMTAAYERGRRDERGRPRGGAVLTIVASLTGEFTTRDAVLKVGTAGKRKEAYNALAYLVRKKRIERTGYGRYRARTP